MMMPADILVREELVLGSCSRLVHNDTLADRLEDSTAKR
jgi:hypothetical protein